MITLVNLSIGQKLGVGLEACLDDVVRRVLFYCCIALFFEELDFHGFL